MTVVLHRMCVLCGQQRTCAIVPDTSLHRYAICLSCANDALRQLAARFVLDDSEQASLERGLADRKAGRMYPWSEVKADLEALVDNDWYDS